MRRSPVIGGCRLYTIYNEYNSVSSCVFRDDVSSRQGLRSASEMSQAPNFTLRSARREIITICLSHALGVTFFGCSSILEGENQCVSWQESVGGNASPASRSLLQWPGRRRPSR